MAPVVQRQERQTGSWEEIDSVGGRDEVITGGSRSSRGQRSVSSTIRGVVVGDWRLIEGQQQPEENIELMGLGAWMSEHY